MELLGIHHLTAISAQIRENKRFYTGTLGMRLVKRSVNQDDVSAYHLFYADAVGSPGSDMTFFDWPVPRERRGGRSIVRTSFRVDGSNGMDYWTQRFDQLGVAHETPTVRDGRLTLAFEDPEGQRLALVDGGVGDAHPWDKSPVPAGQQIRGLGPIVISVPELQATDLVLRDVMGMRPVRTYPESGTSGDTVHVYEMGTGGTGAELHVAVQPGLAVAGQGAGGAHHVAFRSADVDYDAWADRLNELRVPNSGKVDRYWFRSLYFREPNGVLFEIATDGPGFGVDENMETLGETVVLAPFLEPHRAEIIANLKPID
jgi:glyoxalase family protein